eukprot:gnl/Hemi2/443_TR152_c0_g1_i1.p2 gnl/Hemi2/443_TR152_c0_g1~~gnl/Hemi2/443_TR152_c0_g1_i1.p2  ORF type:complete len:154 (-),score=22.79 gnl/Hemi2/443_TR152_c0_g1_i1:46-507(-)
MSQKKEKKPKVKSATATAKPAPAPATPAAAPPPTQPAALDEAAQELLKINCNEDDTSATFSLVGEDHTLGNSIRYILARKKGVSFCGYSVPHPAEDKMNIRIQTEPGVNVTAALHSGVEDLRAICEHVMATFDEELLAFEKTLTKSSSKMEVC